MDKNQATVIASVICAAIDYYVQAQRCYTTDPMTPETQDLRRRAAQGSLILALEALEDPDAVLGGGD